MIKANVADASLPQPPSSSSSTSGDAATMGDEWIEDDKELAELLCGAQKDDTADERFRSLRRHVVERGLKPCSRQRPLVWKLLLGVMRLDAATYARLVSLGATSVDDAIRDDASRTFRSDATVRERIRDEQMIRILNALRRLNGEVDDDGHGPNRCPVCASFLYVMTSELEAFWSLHALATRYCPTYFACDLHGAHSGAVLVATCLQKLDLPLFEAIKDKGAPHLSTKTFEACIFPLLMSLFSCVKPLQQVVLIWDALFALGAHFAVLVCLARCISLRDKILQAKDPLLLFQPRNLPPLEASALITRAIAIAPGIPHNLYDLVKQHPTVRLSREKIYKAALCDQEVV